MSAILCCDTDDLERRMKSCDCVVGVRNLPPYAQPRGRLMRADYG